MARYIDADALIELLDERGYFKHAIYRSVIEDFPTADVVPKSEVDKWIRECEELQGRLIELEKEVAREIFEEIEKISEIYENRAETVCYFPNGFLTELKKKYTEGK